MADQSQPSSTPENSTSPVELNFDDSAIDKPRLKRRKLATGRANSTEPGQAPITSSASEPTPLPDSPRPEPVRAAATSIPAAKPMAGNPFAPSAQSLPTTPLYYTSGVPKQKENVMKPNSTTTAGASPAVAGATPAATAGATARPAAAATPASSTQARPAVTTSPVGTSAPNPGARPATAAASSSAQPRTAASSGATASPGQTRPASSGAAPSSAQARPASGATSASTAQARPASSSSSSTALSTTVTPPGKATSVNDFRANVERQTREQKSVGGMITMIVYALAALFILGGFLAGYGAYTVSKQLHRQSVTVSELDNRYTAQNEALTAQLKATNDSLTSALTQTQAQISRQQELLTRQQDTLNRLVAATQDNTNAWRTERQSRAAETASLRVRLRDLEDQPRLHP